MCNENKKDGLCTVCSGNGYVRIMPGTMMKSMRLCPFCKGTGNELRGETNTLKKHNGTEWVDHKLTADEYQELAARTIDPKLDVYAKSMHALFGMVGEVGEIHSLYQKTYQGHSLDWDDAKKEVGDLLWFIAEYCTVNGWKLSDVMVENISKLKDRYPDGFNSDRSVNREEYTKTKEKKKELTYGDIFNKFLEKHPEISGTVLDYRPYVHNSKCVDYTIIIWFEDGSTALYSYDGWCHTFRYI